MNFLELQNKVIEQLAENSTPQHWTLSEIKDNLNEGYRETLRRTCLGNFLSPLLQAERGAFYIPTDMMTFQKLYYQGRPLTRVSVEYLESRYSGTSFNDAMRGAGRYFENNFRDNEGTPIHFYIEDNKVKLYPKPETSVTVSSIRTTVSATLAAGSTTLTLPSAIPLDETRVDVWLGGIFQFFDQWSIVNTTRIDFSGSSVGVDLDALVRYIADTVDAYTLSKTREFLVFVGAGGTRVNIPGGYVQGIGALSLKKNGVTLAPSDYTESSPWFIVLNTATAIDSMFEIAVTHPDPDNAAAMLYTGRPNPLYDDTDEPSLLPEDFHQSCWQYACGLCLSREGKKTQDLQKAELMFARYDKTIEPLVDLSRPDVSFDPAVTQPFTY